MDFYEETIWNQSFFTYQKNEECKMEGKNGKYYRIWYFPLCNIFLISCMLYNYLLKIVFDNIFVLTILCACIFMNWSNLYFECMVYIMDLCHILM
jgi:hypothetical protein